MLQDKKENFLRQLNSISIKIDWIPISIAKLKQIKKTKRSRLRVTLKKMEKQMMKIYLTNSLFLPEI